VRIQHESLGRALVKVFVGAGAASNRMTSTPTALGDVNLVVEDRLHKLPVVLHHRTLAGGKHVRLRPTQAGADAEPPDFGVLVDAYLTPRPLHGDDLIGYLRSLSALPSFFVRCQASHQEHRYARSSFGALAVAIWCEAVARASPSLAYFRFPLTGHFDSLSTTNPPRRFFFAVVRSFAFTEATGSKRRPDFALER
jgi:hypothetical protein